MMSFCWFGCCGGPIFTCLDCGLAQLKIDQYCMQFVGYARFWQ